MFPFLMQANRSPVIAPIDAGELGPSPQDTATIFGWAPNNIGERHKPIASRVVLQSTARPALISHTIE